MFCTACARRDGRWPRRIVAAGLLALAALAAFARAGQAQEQGQGNILQQGDHILKQGAKLLGLATDVAPPADFVVKSRGADPPGFIPVFQPPPEPARPALEGVNLKAVKSQLDELQKKHDALRAAYPPAAKALAEQQAAKKKPQTNAANAQQ